jgi:hypothetical protein
MVHVREDGTVWGEVLMRDWGCTLPREFQLPYHERFFDIPPELSGHQLVASPHHEEIIVSLMRSGGYADCSFLMSQLPTASRLRSALADLIQKIQGIVERGPDASHTAAS